MSETIIEQTRMLKRAVNHALPYGQVPVVLVEPVLEDMLTRLFRVETLLVGQCICKKITGGGPRCSFCQIRDVLRSGRS